MEMGWTYWTVTWLVMAVAFLVAWACIIGGCIRIDRGSDNEPEPVDDATGD